LSVAAIGAYAGLAAGVGLVVLSVLYVAHAREVRRLHTWAGRAPERARPAVIVTPRRSHARMRPVAAALVAVLVLVGAAVRLLGDGGGEPSGGARAKDVPSKRTRTDATVQPGDVTVAVLNGTTVPGLAAALRDELAAAGFQKGTINNFSDQQLAASVVQYAPGHRAEAQAVSRRVGISRREPVTAESRALAGDATVIVIAGADHASGRQLIGR
jgi:LytR cell envelope-related transcriptional attenuator